MTGAEGPRINDREFVVTQKNAVVAILPVDSVEPVAAALAAAGADLGQTHVLHGDHGSRILDIEGIEHGFWAWVVRSLQRLGTASNERENYANALKRGEAIIAVPAHGRDEVLGYAQVLAQHDGSRMLHFGEHAVENLSY